MSVNGVTNHVSTDSYKSYSEKQTKSTEVSQEKAAASVPAETNGVIYEKSTQKATQKAKSYHNNPEIVARLKADAEQRTQQLQDLVKDMMSKQGNAYGSANSMWKFLSGGNFTVDAATKSKAQADIAEDGYWGVNKTSDRILEFAEALSGGEPKKMEEMRNAFIKGYKQATGTWGKDLPDISSRTYDAVMEKFDKYAEDNKTETE